MRGITTLFIIISFYTFGNAQYKPSARFLEYYHQGLSVGFGLNLVDNSGGLNFLKGYLNYESMALKNPFSLSVEYRQSRKFSFLGRMSVNQWISNKGIIDRKIIPSDLNYLGFDGGVKFYFDELLERPSSRNWFELFVEGGLGYFQIDKGQLSINFGGGAIFWISKTMALNLQLMTKSTKNELSLFSSSHYQTFIGFKIMI